MSNTCRACLFLFLIWLAGSVRADWTVESSSSDKSAGAKVEHRKVIVAEPETGERTTLHLALFPMRSATLRVVDNPAGDDLAAAMQRDNCIAGANGGYFDTSDAPVGLVITGGKMLAPFRKAPLLSGVLVASNNRIDLLRVAEYSPKRKATEALQCGPFLVDHGRVVPGLNNNRTARRTFVAVGDSERVAIGFCSDATLAGLGKILATPGIVQEFKVQRALNLDGGSSSAFWFAGEHRVFSIGEQKTVRNFVGIVTK